MTALEQLHAVVADNRAGRPRGIPSWCTAHPDTLRAILRAHRGNEAPILFEATCNQVNHQGGYTGMTPEEFRRFAEALALEAGIDARRIIFGGDHLGPNPWRHLASCEAMAEAKEMVRAYAGAGFSKIHLDASMACADDENLAEAAMAERAAELCDAAEAAASQPLSYVIGTEVPIPGGETEALDALAVTRPEAVRRTWNLHEAAFDRLGLGEAFQRVIGVVVQPGVDFGNSQVFAFDPVKAQDLIGSAGHLPHVVFEAHSTDYQSVECLSGLVAGHFAILKVGPELTHAYREAVFAMAALEQRLSPKARSDVINVIEEVMNEDDRHWRGYVPRGGEERALKLTGLSDRVRYYWPDKRILEAVERQRVNIDGGNIPAELVMKHAGATEDGAGPLSARIVQSKVGAIVGKYLRACGSAA
jgi:D-tagatose-bisphosphate aldolase class II non-catalytic subunit